MKHKSWMTALLLSFFLGPFGIDRLYLGYGNWWLKLITVGGLGFWALYDLVMILINKMPDGKGNSLAK
ncbi:MAG: TM2 domain-containing protein [Chloroflexi bacterium]|nr:TM2 domain-containing protein [Chloroflexota bacterium]